MGLLKYSAMTQEKLVHNDLLEEIIQYRGEMRGGRMRKILSAYLIYTGEGGVVEEVGGGGAQRIPR
jgi:hypothetical protein